jgi:hypothetical protein
MEVWKGRSIMYFPRGFVGRFIVFLTCLISLQVMVYAVATNGTGSFLGSSQYSFVASTFNRTADPGNISLVNLTTNASTTRWEAFTGNVTARTFLGDSAGVSLFEWQDSLVTGEVYLTINSAVPSFGSLSNLTWEWVNRLDGTGNWSFTTGDDKINDTFRAVYSFTVQGTDYRTFAVNTTGPYVTGILNMTNTNATHGARHSTLFVSNITDNGIGYNGATVDYEIMVPSLPIDTWFFYVELD